MMTSAPISSSLRKGSAPATADDPRRPVDFLFGQVRKAAETRELLALFQLFLR
jgi:hypothetical protein